MPALPLVTIGLPVYNGADFLRSALDSLLAQDYPNFQLVISDNASTDGVTEAIGREYAARDGRVRYDRAPHNTGSWGNFSRVYRLGTGEYFMWTSHHDLWAPSMVRRCVERLEADPTLALAYPRTSYIDHEGQQVPDSEHFIDTSGQPTARRLERVLGEYPICAMMGVHRRAVLERLDSPWGIGLYSPLDHPTPDAILLLRSAALGGFGLVDETLYFNRQFRQQTWSPERKVKQLAPERPTPRLPRWAITRDLARVLAEADLDAADRLRLGKITLRTWVWPHRQRLLYELDVLRLYSRFKGTLEKV
jgi:glycosyltransferase involved in cell wall biosynthesis